MTCALLAWQDCILCCWWIVWQLVLARWLAGLLALALSRSLSRSLSLSLSLSLSVFLFLLLFSSLFCVSPTRTHTHRPGRRVRFEWEHEIKYSGPTFYTFPHFNLVPHRENAKTLQPDYALCLPHVVPPIQLSQMHVTDRCIWSLLIRGITLRSVFRTEWLFSERRAIERCGFNGDTLLT